MIREELVEKFLINDDVEFLDPPDPFDKGIVGVTEDSNHIVYCYEKLALALAEQYEADAINDGNELLTKEEYLAEANDYIDMNIIRGLCMHDVDTRPVIIFGVE